MTGTDDLAPGFVLATWVGPYGWRMADGTTLDTGVTVKAIPADEAVDSEFWQVAPDVTADVIAQREANDPEVQAAKSAAVEAEKTAAAEAKAEKAAAAAAAAAKAAQTTNTGSN